MTLDVRVHDILARLATVCPDRVGATLGPVSPLEMVGPRKRARLRALAAAWARQHRAELPRFSALRIDVVGLRIDAAGRIAEWQHVRAAC